MPTQFHALARPFSGTNVTGWAILARPVIDDIVMQSPKIAEQDWVGMQYQTIPRGDHQRNAL
jgi:hypothetical protein